MILELKETVEMMNSVPRVGGGDPEISKFGNRVEKCSPRRRG